MLRQSTPQWSQWRAVMNVCSFTKKRKLGKVIKQELKMAMVHGMQTSDERLYKSIEHGRRGWRVVMLFKKTQRSEWHVIWLIRRANRYRQCGRKRQWQIAKLLNSGITETLEVYGSMQCLIKRAITMKTRECWKRGEMYARIPNDRRRKKDVTFEYKDGKVNSDYRHIVPQCSKHQ